jgi:hypothetical protein
VPADPPIAFGDQVRIRSTAVTDGLGLTGLKGQVYGETTPSVTRVVVIGELRQDRALNVRIEQRGEALWFAPELLEFIDHGAGTTATIDGAPQKWVRAEDGEWVESPTGRRFGDLARRILDLLRPKR